MGNESSHTVKAICTTKSDDGVVVQYRSYINFLMPATLINIAVTTAMSLRVGVLAEGYTGFVGRLRAMPISMFAVLVARTLSDALRLTVQLTVAVLAAVLFLDFRPSGIVGIATALGLAVLVSWGLWLGVRGDRHLAAQGGAVRRSRSW